MYPPNWPRCVFCGAPALDGHLTCGSAACPEGVARDLERAPYDDPDPEPSESVQDIADREFCKRNPGADDDP